MKRREFLAAGAATLVAQSSPLAARRSSASFFDPHGRSLGLQLYTLDPDLEQDFDGTLRSVARIGIRLVELASLHGRSAMDVRRSLEAAGLVCMSIHVPAAPWSKATSGATLSDMDRLIDDAHALGVTDIVLPSFQLPRDFTGSADGTAGQREALGASSTATGRFLRMAEFLNETGQRLAPAGLRMGYHNHNTELAPIGETNGLEILLSETDPALVSFEMDAGWVAAAGRDPLDLLRRFPGRFTQMHVKDIKASTVANYAMKQDPAEVGSGTIDWSRILPVARASGVRRYYIEQEPPFAGPRMAAIAKSYAYLKALKL